MVQILILLSLLTLILAWVARWWFWWRVRDAGRRIECSMSVADLKGKLGFPMNKPNEQRDAAALGAALRECGLKLLEQDGEAAAKGRRTGWWSLRVLPGLLGVVLVFSAVTKRFAFRWVLAVGLLVIALHVLVRVSGIGIELKAVKRAMKELQRKGGVRRISEEEQIVLCARGSVWDTVLPW